MKQQGLSARAMGRVLGCSPSTITRELARHTLAALPYGSHRAQLGSASRRVAARPAGRLDFDGAGWDTVRTLLNWKRSPQQIAAAFKRVSPDEPGRHLSHETIDTATYAQPRGELRRQLVACLRHGAGNKSSVGVLVERTSRLVLPAKMDDATTASALAGFSAQAEFGRRAAAQGLRHRPARRTRPIH